MVISSPSIPARFPSRASPPAVPRSAGCSISFSRCAGSTGLCQGPATSVMGLAPGEVVTVGLRTRSTRTFSSLIRDAAESSRSSSHSDRETGPAQKPVGGAAGIGGLIGGIVSAIGEQAGASPAGRFVEQLADKVGDQVGREANKIADFGAARAEQAIDFVPIFVSRFGSIFGDALGAIGGAVGTVVGGVAGAVAGIGTAAGNAISDLVDNVVGGAAGAGAAAGIVGTVQQISDVVDTVERSESESHLRETNVTTSTESEQTIQRTFGNPYLDRSLELRFMPVFHRYEVTTVPVSARAGLATIVADLDPAERPAPSAGGLAERFANLRSANSAGRSRGIPRPHGVHQLGAGGRRGRPARPHDDLAPTGDRPGRRAAGRPARSGVGVGAHGCTRQRRPRAACRRRRGAPRVEPFREGRGSSAGRARPDHLRVIVPGATQYHPTPSSKA